MLSLIVFLVSWFKEKWFVGFFSLVLKVSDLPFQVIVPLWKVCLWCGHI